MACDAEVLQAVGRTRFNRRTAATPLRIDIINLAGASPHILADEFIRLDRLLDEGDLTPAELAAARGVSIDPSDKGATAVLAVLTGQSVNATKLRTRRRRGRRKPTEKGSRAQIAARDAASNLPSSGAAPASDAAPVTAPHGVNPIIREVLYKQFDTVSEQAGQTPDWTSPPATAIPLRVRLRGRSRYWTPTQVAAPDAGGRGRHGPDRGPDGRRRPRGRKGHRPAPAQAPRACPPP